MAVFLCGLISTDSTDTLSIYTDMTKVIIKTQCLKVQTLSG